MYFTEKRPTNYREAAVTNGEQYGKYVQSLQESGIWCSQNPLSHHVLSLKHDKDIVEKMLCAMDKALDASVAK